MAATVVPAYRLLLLQVRQPGKLLVLLPLLLWLEWLPARWVIPTEWAHPWHAIKQAPWMFGLQQLCSE